ncbi:recombinase family protein [Crassaminicella thermophila]|uniref:Recombinase family protein n=1 Tax=Crassaminicella thermophila TaxID=2599308 RepID=A0A5C0SC16_CRATE|nr:recombinase family protein [Crassaminicella thermophila]QEK11650.1 recombinase family protein [Crassaminicella thermophila]
MKAAIYSRKSKFTGKGESIQNQIELCKEYAQKHFNIDEFLVYEDEGFSGGNVDRPEFQRLIKDVKKKKFNILICYRLDRISRNISDFSSTMELLEENDISFVSIKEQFDTSTPMGRAMMYISSVFAQLERETIAERIRDNMYQLARSGRWLGGKTPTGYKSEAIIYHDENLVKRKAYKLAPISKELELVKKIYNKYLEFQSLTKLESWTLENGITTKNRNNFDKSALKLILTNPVYCIADDIIYEYFQNLNADVAAPLFDFDNKHGLMVFNKHNQKKKTKVVRKDESEWIIAVGKHEGIIASRDWIKVQNILNKNSSKAPRAGTGKYGLVTRLLRCNNCGSKMRVSYKTVNGEVKNYYYRCLLKERSRKSKCDIPNVNGKVVDDLIVNEIKKLAFDENKLYKELARKKDNIKHLTKSHESEKNRLQKELKKYEESINNLTMQLAKNANSTASKYIIQQIEALDNKITDIKKKINNMDEVQESTLLEQMNLELVESSIRKFATDFENLTIDEQKKILEQIIDSITWDGEKIEINIFCQK